MNSKGYATFPVYLDNIVFSLQRAGGISVYWYELIRRLARSCDRLVMFESKAAASNLFRKKLIEKVNIRRETDFLPLAVLRYLPLLSRIEGPAIFHSSYYRTTLQRDVAHIVTVHDFTYERYRHGLRRFAHAFQKKWALELADGIICISESTKRDLIDLYPEFADKDIRVIYQAVSDDFFPLVGRPQVDEEVEQIIAAKYIMFVGARDDDYKNFNLAVQVTHAFPDMRLLVIGGGGLTAAESNMLQDKLPERFRHFQRVDNELLNIFYNHAFCLLYPSSYEGFGMPPIEAMKAGCPVAGLNVSSVPEVCGGGGMLADRPVVTEFTELIRALEQPDFRKQKIQDGLRNAARFSWDDCHDRTVAFYLDVYDKKYRSGRQAAGSGVN